MGLKQDLINAKVKAAKETGMTMPLDTKPGSFIERDAHYTSKAIIDFITNADFTITQLKAPIILEDLKSPDLPVNVGLETLLGDKAPILDTLKKVAAAIPGGNSLIGALEDEIQKAVEPLLVGGSTLPGLNLGKEEGGLQSTGYVYIGEDPDSQEAFDVEDEDGQRQFTTVKLIKQDAREFA